MSSTGEPFLHSCFVVREGPLAALSFLGAAHQCSGSIPSFGVNPQPSAGMSFSWRVPSSKQEQRVQIVHFFLPCRFLPVSSPLFMCTSGLCVL